MGQERANPTDFEFFLGLQVIAHCERRKRHLSSYACQENWGVGGGKEAQEEGDMYTVMTNSRCSMAETKTTL